MTLAESDAFVQALTASPRAQVRVAGVTREGNPLWLVTVSADGNAPLDATDLFLVGSQHGFEPSGREATHRILRNLAFAPEPPPFTVTAIPTANPWGAANNSRFNSDGVDINRTHVDLASREGRAIETAITACNPALILDLHEWGAATADMSVKWAQGQVAPTVKAWGEGCYTDLVTALAPTVTVSMYPDTGHEGSLSVAHPAVGQPTFLLEARHTLTGDQRVTAHMATVTWFHDYLTTNLEHVRDVKNNAQAWCAREGITAHLPTYMYGRDGGPAPAYTSAVRGYVVPSTLTATHLIPHGIRWEPVDDGHVYVSMGQPKRLLVAWLFDQTAPAPVTNDVRAVTEISDPVVDDLFRDDLSLYTGRALRVGSRPVGRVDLGSRAVWGF